MNALTCALNGATIRMSARTAPIESNRGRLPAARTSSVAPITASSVFPTAMPAAAPSGMAVAALAKKAPTAMPGHAPRPRMTSAAIARPVGGQMSETFWPMVA